MVLTEEFSISPLSDTIFRVESPSTHLCPYCNSELNYRDRVKRMVRRSRGRIFWFLIRRFKCSLCQTYHRELPSFIAPYKHYDCDLIEGVLDNFITSETVGYEDHPDEVTIRRWKKLPTPLTRETGWLRIFIKETLLMLYSAKKVPCRNCSDRKPNEDFPNAKNCHDSCPAYQAWKAEVNERKELLHKISERERILYRRAFTTH